MPRWWARPSPALDGGRARAATGAWLPGTRGLEPPLTIAVDRLSVVEELKSWTVYDAATAAVCVAARLQNAETE